MNGELIGYDALALANGPQQLAGQLGTLTVVDLPAHDLAAEQVHEQVKVEVDAAHLGGQVADVPAINLIGPGGHQCAWLAVFCATRFPSGGASTGRLHAAAGTGSTHSPHTGPGQPGEAQWTWS